MNKAMPINRRQLMAFLGSPLLATSTAFAQALTGYPNKPVKIVVTYATGGANDITARIYAALLSERFQQTFLVESRPGASGITGTAAVASGNPDGYTLLLGAGGTMTINPGLFLNLPYDPLRDFAPIGLVAQAPLVVVVPPNLPVQSIQDLVAYAKQRPDGISFATPGSGTPLHLAAELFLHQAGIKGLHVPYRGSAPALTDLMSGRVNVMFDVQGSSLQFIQSNRLRALAVTSSKRSLYLPDVPTMQEAGLQGFEVTSWFGLFAPAQTPAAIVNQLSSVLQEVAQTAETAEKLAPLGMDAVHSSPQALGELVRKEQAKWREMIQVANIQVE